MKNVPEWKSVEAQNPSSEPPAIAPDSTTAGWLNKSAPGLQRDDEAVEAQAVAATGSTEN